MNRTDLLIRILPLLLLTGCQKGGKKPGAETSEAHVSSDSGADTDAGADSSPRDADGDGVPATGDCDDANAEVYPGAPEACNEVDDNCDGSVDEGVATTWYPDSDGDGYGALDGGVSACTQPNGTAPESSDCDDANAAVCPGATEACDAQDNDCDGSVDEGFDLDGDGHLNPSACPDLGDDCDDDDVTLYPGAPDVCDGQANDCSDATWTTDDGLVSFAPADGTLWTALESEWSVGTSIDAASYEFPQDGTLWICGGTWNVEVAVEGMDVAIRSLDLSDPATLSGDGDGTGVDALDTTLTISGLVISDFDDGITLASSDGTFDNLTVQDNGHDPDYPGGGIYATSSTLSCEACTVTGNDHFSGGGGIEIRDSVVSVVDSTIADNATHFTGGGISCEGVGTLVVEDSTVSGNTADWQGGGVYADCDSVELRRIVFYANSVTTEFREGGALYVNSGDAVVEETDFVSNTAYDGGAVSVDTPETVSFASCTFTENAADIGGALVVYQGTLEMEDSIISGNSASSQGGGIDLTAFYGASASTVARLDNVEISGNTSGYRSGGINISWFTMATLQDCAISNNTADRFGGGLDLYGDDDAAPTVTVSGGSISENEAGDYGGGVLVDGESSLEVESVSFSGNLPEDTWSSASDTGYTWGEGASFSCGATGCE